MYQLITTLQFIQSKLYKRKAHTYKLLAIFFKILRGNEMSLRSNTHIFIVRPPVGMGWAVALRVQGEAECSFTCVTI